MKKDFLFLKKTDIMEKTKENNGKKRNFFNIVAQYYNSELKNKLSILKTFLKNDEFFENSENNFSNFYKARKFKFAELIGEQGKELNNLYLITKGKVTVIKKYYHNIKTTNINCLEILNKFSTKKRITVNNICTLKKGIFIGLDEILNNKMVYKYSFKVSSEFTQVYEISVEQFLKNFDIENNRMILEKKNENYSNFITFAEQKLFKAFERTNSNIAKEVRFFRQKSQKYLNTDKNFFNKFFHFSNIIEKIPKTNSSEINKQRHIDSLKELQFNSQKIQTPFIYCKNKRNIFKEQKNLSLNSLFYAKEKRKRSESRLFTEMTKNQTHLESIHKMRFDFSLNNQIITKKIESKKKKLKKVVYLKNNLNYSESIKKNDKNSKKKTFLEILRKSNKLILDGNGNPNKVFIIKKL